jgi:hypothetical protein
MYPGFPVLNVEWGAIWNTTEPIDDEDPDVEKEFDDWGCGDENEQEDDC